MADMHSPSLDTYTNDLAVAADDLSRRVASLGKDPPSAAAVVNDIVTQALAGELQLIDPLVGQLAAQVQPGGSGFKRAIDAGVAKYLNGGGNPADVAPLQAAAAAFEADGAQQLASLLQVLRGMVH